LGDSGVGKTSLLSRFVFESFDEQNMPTVAAGYKAKIVEVPGTNERVKMNIWDTAGQEKYRSLGRMYYTGADAAIIIYDATYRNSFDSVAVWIDDLRTNIPNEDTILIAIVGNKSDKAEDLQVMLQEAHELQRKTKAFLVRETSAKDNTGVTELFEEIAKKLISNSDKV
jgi:small GTP-binding protein